MEYTNQIKNMCKVTCGASHGCAPIPQEGEWTYAREIKDINGFTHGIGWCAPQQGACKLTLEWLVFIAMLASIASCLCVVMMFKNVKWFEIVFLGVPNRPEKEKSGKKWWKGAIITVLISFVTYPFLTQLGQGLFPLPKAYHAIDIANKLNIKKENVNQFVSMLLNMYKMFIELDCSLIEINPLVENNDGLICIDAKVNFDDNALYRHPSFLEDRDELEEDPKELEASKYDLNFVSLNGNIGCLVNGAGLAMATMDIIKSYGGEPANFLDVGGSATVEKVTAAFKILLSDKNVKAIMVNIFGGIMKCDIIAMGIVEAVKTVKLNVPLVVS